MNKEYWLITICLATKTNVSTIAIDKHPVDWLVEELHTKHQLLFAISITEDQYRKML